MSDVSTGTIVVGFIGVLLTALTTLIGALLLNIKATIDSVDERLRMLNGKVGRLEQWRDDHLDQDAKDFDRVKEMIENCPAKRELS